MNISADISGLIGRTPLVRLNRITEFCRAEVYAKLEYFNPGGSIKDRIALSMIEKAERDGLIDPDTVIIEPTSGNTGIGLAMVCAVKGYSCVITMPDSTSLERRKILKGYGACLKLTPADGGMKAAITMAEEIAREHDKSFIPMQFSNPANPEIHMNTTASEIWEDTEGQVDIFIAGVGTGGTITGTGRALKQKNPVVRAVAVEPDSSPVLSGGEPGPHAIQGIGAGFVPDNVDRTVIDEIIRVKDDQAIDMAQRLMKEEGIFAGISSGANVYAAVKVAEREENTGKKIVVIVCDTGERYLSTSLFEEES